MAETLDYGDKTIWGAHDGQVTNSPTDDIKAGTTYSGGRTTERLPVIGPKVRRVALATAAVSLAIVAANAAPQPARQPDIVDQTPTPGVPPNFQLPPHTTPNNQLSGSLRAT